MEGYGLHSSQIASDMAMGHTVDLNRQIGINNQQRLSDFTNKLSGIKASDQKTTKKDKEEGEGFAAKAIIGAGVNLKKGSDLISKYKGLGNALTAGTSENLYNLTGGKIGNVQTVMPKMGSAETMVRGGEVGPITTGKLEMAQRADVSVGESTLSNLTDHTNLSSLSDIGVKAAPTIDTAGLDLTGKIINKGLLKAGQDTVTAGRIASVAGGAIGAGEALYTGIEDFGEGKFKTEGGVSKAGDITSMIGGALDLASVAVPVLAPIAGLADLAGSLLDAIGGHIDQKKKDNQDISGVPQPALQQRSAVQSSAGQVANQSSQSSSKQQLQGKSASF